jgi:hypothetical protein
MFKVKVRSGLEDEEVMEGQVREAVKEKLVEALDERRDGQIREFTAVGVVIESIVAAGPDA